MSKQAQVVLAIAALEAKLTKAQETAANLAEKLADQQNLLANLAAIEALGVGSSIVVTVGRAETKQKLVGEIVAVKPGEVTIEGEGEDAREVVGDRLFKVKVSRTGDDFDAEFVTVPESKVELPATEAAEGAEAAE